jgi:hypothetical protein
MHSSLAKSLESDAGEEEADEDEIDGFVVARKQLNVCRRQGVLWH